MLVDACARELERQQTAPQKLGEKDEYDSNGTGGQEKIERVEGTFLTFYGALRTNNMRDKTNDADLGDERDEKVRRKYLSNALEEKDDAYSSLLLQAEILETLIALVAERPEVRAMLAERIETIKAIVRAYTIGEYEDEDGDKEKKDGLEELLNEIGDVTEEELKAAFVRAQMQLSDASGALLALLTQVPIRLPDTYTIHDSVDAKTDVTEKNVKAFESFREAAVNARTLCAKLLGGEEYVQEIIDAQTHDVVSRYAAEQKARNR
jgi:hypothetical protein